VDRWRLLLVDDHALFREGLAGLFAYQDDFLVVGEADDAASALAQTAAHLPDIVLMDLDMPELDGLAATRLISAEQPDVKVVILTASEEDAHLFEAIKSGAQGYLFKNLASDELFRLGVTGNGPWPPAGPPLGNTRLGASAPIRDRSRFHPQMCVVQ